MVLRLMVLGVCAHVVHYNNQGEFVKDEDEKR